MLTSILKNRINRFKNIDAEKRFSDYFDKEVVNVSYDFSDKYQQVDILPLSVSEQGITCHLVYLGLRFKVLKFTSFTSFKELVNFLQNS